MAKAYETEPRKTELVDDYGSRGNLVDDQPANLQKDSPTDVIPLEPRKSASIRIRDAPIVFGNK